MGRTVVLVCAAGVLLAGCGGGSSGGSSPSTSSRCEVVSKKVVDTILSEPKGGPMTVVKSAAVKSTSFKQVWMVALSFTVPGVSDRHTGVWAVNSIDKPDLITAVDGFAQNFTGWQTASKRGVNGNDDGIKQARECVS